MVDVMMRVVCGGCDDESCVWWMWRELCGGHQW